MAKLALINREKKRREVVERYKVKRAELSKIILDNNLTEAERYLARLKLQDFPRNSSPVRLRNRCALTGRARGVFTKFGLARNKLREIAMRGEVPGVVKSSW